jgi:hypothetical protein
MYKSRKQYCPLVVNDQVLRIPKFFLISQQNRIGQSFDIRKRAKLRFEYSAARHRLTQKDLC